MPEQLQTLHVILGGLIVALVLVYLWARKSSKHPEYAAQKEASFDAFLEGLKKYAPDQADQVLSKIQAVDMVKAGQSAYAAIEPRLASLEAKMNELIARLPKQ